MASSPPLILFRAAVLVGLALPVTAARGPVQVGPVHVDAVAPVLRSSMTGAAPGGPFLSPPPSRVPSRPTHRTANIKEEESAVNAARAVPTHNTDLTTWLSSPHRLHPIDFTIVNAAPGVDAPPPRSRKARAKQGSPVIVPPGSGSGWRSSYHERWNAKFDVSKRGQVNSRVWPGNNSDGHPVLSSLRYIVLPIFWSDQDPSLSENAIDLNDSAAVIAQVRDYYQSMSWGHTSVSFMQLPQTVLGSVTSSSPDFQTTSSAARAIVDASPYEQVVDYDAIIMVYYTAQTGPFSGGGGWANVNGDFQWDSGPLLNFGVLRHEVGHNFGHPHHRTNKYYLRANPLGGDAGSWYDGFDMMSGGNGYAISHFHPASKWWFGWIPDACIGWMAPEGNSADCPTCTSSGTFVLKAFDDGAAPPDPGQGDLMGIHIPVTWADQRLLSYWVTYRGGIDEAARGASVHVVWFAGFGGVFGATFDSYNYDAFGDTDTTLDSVVLPGTCYVVSPSTFLNALDPAAAREVVPVVCVDDISVGKNLTVTISFTDLAQEQVATVAPASELVCGPQMMQGASLLSAGETHLFHITGAGADGAIDFGVCPSATSSSGFSAKVYVYDDYPSAALTFGAPLAYGSFKSYETSTVQCCAALGADSIPVDGMATAVKISNNREDFLHLNEIQIFDETGANVASEATCYSRNSGWDGDPKFLNDGVVGTYPETGNSHSSWMDPGNHDICVLAQPANVTRVVVYPWHDPSRLWMTGRIRDLQLEVFALAFDQGAVSNPKSEQGLIQLEGLLFSQRLTAFSSSNTAPQDVAVVANRSVDSVPCPVADLGLVFPGSDLNYRAEMGEAWVIVQPSSDAPVGGQMVLNANCTMAACHANKYFDSVSSQCASCPADTIASAGSVGAGACVPCPHGSQPTTSDLALSEPQCELTVGFEWINASSRWRVWAPDFHVNPDWKLDLKTLHFFSDAACSVQIAPGAAIDSGNAGVSWGPTNALDNTASGTWGGRRDSFGTFWLGSDWGNEQVSVKCLLVEHTADPPIGMLEARVQAWDAVEGRWINAAIAYGLLNGNFDGYVVIPEAAPSPTATPTPSPTATSSPTPVGLSSCASRGPIISPRLLMAAGLGVNLNSLCRVP